ncbi:AbrB family transcriptional regulator [Staphylococcus muscae]|uniref:Aminopeptidase n=1 Tax=Staphylococcus muscae TaxID=1294 RepID=A0A240C271_9STAP|nr:AbrB family transcriptional regulator [Staphylococcus muscae]AVQ32965.1 AbrB family transcriptional regulator [Staphylococcus muscae]PNZ05122.1 aminopeptidase [Staphylococcus muscae]GGA89393.1 aminopeptidase [Staphylococcus muscae]SNW02211.1 ammonia monooxygenase [Staphylococcus muscae]
MQKQYIGNNLLVLAVSVLCGWILWRCHMILPWMFGPIVGSLIVVKGFKREIHWPHWLSELGLIMLGVQIGSSFTRQVIEDIQSHWLLIVIVNVLTLTLAIIVSYGFRKIASVNEETAILSVIPGALSQMLVMAEENKRADILVVSLTQTSRIIFVVILVPLFTLFFNEKQQNKAHLNETPLLTETLGMQHLLILIVAIVFVYVLMKKVNFPTKMLLAPIIVLILWNLTTENIFTLDAPIIATAQVIYMIRVGVQIAGLTDRLKGRIALAIAFQNILLITGTLLMVWGLQYLNDIPLNTLFLGAAPGGMAQIVLVALDTGADVAIVSSFHIFRIFFILMLIAPLIDIYLKYRAKKPS